jgi:N-acetylglutamate synthase-like GNAT family acetyltransferase
MNAERTLRWRAMTAADIAEVQRISDLIHPDYPERDDVVTEKLMLSPSTHFMAVDEGAVVRGYAVAYPWIVNDMPQLDVFIRKLPENATVLYIHDVALLPSARGGLLVPDLLQRLSKAARSQGLTGFTLSAMYGSEAAWFRHGFWRVQATGKLVDQLSPYGPAVFMSRPLD